MQGVETAYEQDSRIQGVADDTARRAAQACGCSRCACTGLVVANGSRRSELQPCLFLELSWADLQQRPIGWATARAAYHRIAEQRARA